MSYTTRIEVEISIDPPLTHAELKTVVFAPPLCPFVQTREEETDAGRLVSSFCEALDNGDDGEFGSSVTFASTEQVVRDLLNAFRDHSFTGQIDAAGEEPGDLWRIIVRGSGIMAERAMIVYPSELAEMAKDLPMSTNPYVMADKIVETMGE